MSRKKVAAPALPLPPPPPPAPMLAEDSPLMKLIEAGTAIERAARNLLCASPHNMTERAAELEALFPAWNAAQVESFMAATKAHAALTNLRANFRRECEEMGYDEAAAAEMLAEVEEGRTRE